MKWKMLALLCALVSLLPGEGARIRPGQLLAAASAQGVQAHGFYISCQHSLPTAQAKATVRLFEKAYQRNQTAQASLREDGAVSHLSLAVFVEPDAHKAETVVRHLRNLVGDGKDIAVCLTGRLSSGELLSMGQALLSSAGETALGRMAQDGLVSLAGEGAQVALRRDDTGVQVFFASPFVAMDY